MQEKHLEHAKLAVKSRAAYRLRLLIRAELGDWHASQALARLFAARGREFAAARYEARKAANTPWD